MPVLRQTPRPQTSAAAELQQALHLPPTWRHELNSLKASLAASGAPAASDPQLQLSALKLAEDLGRLPPELQAVGLRHYVQATGLHASEAALGRVGEQTVKAVLGQLDALSQQVFADRGAKGASPIALQALADAWLLLLNGPLKGSKRSATGKSWLSTAQGMWPVRLANMMTDSRQKRRDAARTEALNRMRERISTRAESISQASRHPAGTSCGSLLSLSRSLHPSEAKRRPILTGASLVRTNGWRGLTQPSKSLAMVASSSVFGSSASVSQIPAFAAHKAIERTNRGSEPAGKRRDFTRKELAAHNIKYRHQRLQGTTNVWLRSQGIWYGTYGKVSMGRTFNAPTSQKVAIKEMRQHHKPEAETGRRRKTKPLKISVIEREVAQTQSIRQQIEDHVADIEKLLWEEDNPLEVVRTGQQKSIVFDHFIDQATGKYYMVSTLELGSVRVLSALNYNEETPEVSAQIRVDLAASIGAQILVELAAMHQFAKAAHLDIKLDNLQVNGFGQAKLADFGLTKAIDDKNETPNTYHHIGTIVAPEMLRTPQTARLVGPNLSTATDVFALAVSLLDLLTGARVSPFLRDDREQAKDGADIDAYLRRRNEALTGLLDQLRTDSGFQLPSPLPDTFPNTGVEEIDDYFGRAFRRSSALTLLLLPALEQRPSDRPAAATLAKAVATLLPDAGTPRQTRLLDLFDLAEKRGIYHSVFQDAARFEKLYLDRQVQLLDGEEAPPAV